MTEPSTGPAAAAPDVSAAFAALRAAGYRVSTTRRLMLETLYAHDEPLTAEQVARRIGGEMGGDVASVYRNLETLERLGLVRHFHLGHSPGLYVRAGAGGSERRGDELRVAVRAGGGPRLLAHRLLRRRTPAGGARAGLRAGAAPRLGSRPPRGRDLTRGR